MPRKISVILFDGFELLDVLGPVELLYLMEGYDVELVAPERGPVASSQGVEVVTTVSYEELAQNPGIMLVPGGRGTRPLSQDSEFLVWLAQVAEKSDIVMSVCTGSALLAAAGYSATSNKPSFEWVSSFGKTVDWNPAARWVHDRNRWTSSGVAAGMDMAAAFMAHEQGQDVADAICRRVELEVSKDGERNPFAVS